MSPAANRASGDSTVPTLLDRIWATLQGASPGGCALQLLPIARPTAGRLNKLQRRQ
jgi:hypothetical protein